MFKTICTFLLAATLFSSIGYSSYIIPNGAVTKAKLAALGQQISSSSGGYTHASGAGLTAVTNLTVTITTTGRPVMVALQSDTSNITALIGHVGPASDNYSEFAFFRGATQLSDEMIKSFAPAIGAYIPPSSLHYMDTPTAGTYTYVLKADVVSGTLHVERAVLTAYEL